MLKNGYCIGVDLGGTNIAAGLVDLKSHDIVKKHSVKTNAPRPAESISGDIAELCKKLCSMQGISISDLLWIGVAAPGIVKDNTVVAAINLGWKNEKLGEILARQTGVKTYLSNDANVAAYAEALWGSGDGANSLCALTIGTGVGGGIVLNGKIWEGMNGFAAEIGHMIIVPDGRKCPCGNSGCLEAYCSATALIRETKESMKENPESIMWEEVSGDIDRVSGKTAFKAMARGDRCAIAVIDRFTDYLAIGISNLINIFQPDVVCVGGGISREGDVLLDPVREKVRKTSFGVEGARTKVTAASYQNDAGIIGAALLGLQYQ